MASPSLSKYSRWIKGKDREACALDMQGRKVGFGSWYSRQHGDYTCEEYYATHDNKDRVRTVDLTPEERLNREIKDDDSQKGSDWHECTGQPLLRMNEVPKDLRPNCKKTYIYFANNENQYLPAAYAAEDNMRTIDRIMSHFGQTKYLQGHIPKSRKNQGNKRK